MFTIRTSQISSQLVVAHGFPKEQAQSEFALRSSAMIKNIFGAPNELWLGKPEVFDLRLLSIDSTIEFPLYLQHLLDSWDLILLQFACSFRPAPQCQFVRASIRIRLECTDHIEQPVAQDLYPREIVFPTTMKRELSISPALKLKTQDVGQIEISAFDFKHSREYLLYEPEITSFGLGESSPGWDFNKTISKPITGVKDLLVLVKKPKSVPLKARFEVNAVIKTTFGLISLPDFLIRNTTKPLIEDVYNFC